ncbi:LuxR C-terminal-related transcriptional regulator [Streptomyces sp. NPDC006193]|uniref:LuxR C-terminal-related transcriptional regulator n=1 Tax=Streptomyces sp. NPDC006193 TaxID=3155717 RepID=UPI0033B4B38C
MSTASSLSLPSHDGGKTTADPAARAVPRDADGSRRRRTYTAHVSALDTTVTAAETEFAGAFGLSPGEICGRDLCDLLLARFPALLQRRFADLSEGRTDWFTEQVTGQDGTGRTFCAVLTAVAVAGPDGPAGLVILLSHAEDREPAQPRGEQTLSELDARVLEGVASGASTVQLASRLYMSRQGVEYRVGRLLRRFDAPNRPALVARAHGLGMFAAGQWPPRVLPDFVE